MNWLDTAQLSRNRLSESTTPTNTSHWMAFFTGQGVQRGHLIGGCFEVLDWLRGTDLGPSMKQWQGAILFLETSEDAPSPEVVTFGLRTYAALGILAQLSGILFGRPVDRCHNTAL